jgi:hypothetical protein
MSADLASGYWPWLGVLWVPWLTGAAGYCPAALNATICITQAPLPLRGAVAL